MENFQVILRLRPFLFGIMFLTLGQWTVSAQQLPYTSLIPEARYFWNPAMTGLNKTMDIDLFFRKQWVGFDGSPLTTFAGLNMPFTDYNMAAGGAIYMDRVGPVSKTGLLANYAYHIKDAMGDESLFSMGLQAGFQQYSFNANNAVVVNDGDPFLISNQSAFFPSISAGVYYNSNTKEFKNINSTFIGVSFLQAFATNVLVGEANQVRTRHVIIDLGTRIYDYDTYFEPTLTVNYSTPELMDILIGTKYEVRDKFWAGVGYSTVNELAFHGGFIIDRFGGNRYSKLRIGALANIGVTSEISRFGPGFELFARYQMDYR